MACVGCGGKTQDFGYCPVCSVYERATDSSAIHYPHTVKPIVAWKMHLAARHNGERLIMHPIHDGLVVVYGVRP